MNVIKHIKLFFLTIVFGLPFWLSAQTTSSIYQGEVYDRYTINAGIVNPRITQEPSNGNAYWLGSGTLIGEVGYNTLVYNPNDNFYGSDTLVVNYMTATAFVTITETVIINVKESVVTAYDDYTETNLTTPIKISVLNNDTQTNGSLYIRDILVAAGAEDIRANIDGTITFTPAADFKGIGYFEYLVCNEAGACDNATVSITVHDTANPSNDTLQIYTKKNTAQAILLPLEDYTLDAAPDKGVIDNSEDVWQYVPNTDVVGKDEFTYRNGNVMTLVQVEIIDAEADNLFAIDDYAYTPIDEAVEINFLENDLDAADFDNILIIQQPSFGNLTDNGNGVVTYQPNAGFATLNEFTVDRFSYQVTLADGSIEKAMVYIYVNDFNPSASTFELSVAKNSPLAIQYAVPIDYHSFEVVSQGDLGQVTFYENIDKDVYGQRVIGKKVLLYTPDNQVTGYDEFEVQYCVTPNADCKSVKIKINILDIEISEDEKCVLADCVWEGDTNGDGVVNMQDLLTLGYTIGKTGANRDRSASDVWYGRNANDWAAESVQTKVNLKHSDTDGNGIINGKDTTAISANYGRKHSLTAKPLPPTDPIPYYYGSPDTIPIYGPGAILEIPIILGNENFPVTDIYGITLDVYYSASFFREGTVDVVFDEASWLSYGSSNLSLSKEVVSGKIDAATTRTNAATANGHGKIAKIVGTTIADIDAWRLGDEALTGSIRITITATNGAGEQVNIGSDTYTFKFDPTKAEETATEEFAPVEKTVRIYPNPTTEVLNLSNNVERLEVFNLTGQQVFAAQEVYQVNVKNWSEGVYILRAYTADGEVVNQKFEVVKR